MLEIPKDLNPFNVTKAVDFTDQQIEDYWVDFAGGEGFVSMTKPTSPMTMLILGGKGSGKTHIMRYFSYELQKIRHKSNLIEGIKEEGFIGVYFRCGGLNADRFSGKGIEEDMWKDIFSYFMELWFAQLNINLIIDSFSTNKNFLENEEAICKAITELFDQSKFQQPNNLREFSLILRDLQKEVNFAVNNASFTNKINLSIIVSPGQLTFGIPKILSQMLSDLKTIQFLYLVDEFENLDTQQQKYINTLYREKELPCSFKIGSRLYGVKTFSTFSADEENKEGSEYETLFLDDYLRQLPNYSEFARKLCAKRLEKAGYDSSDMNAYFEVLKSSKYEEASILYAFDNSKTDIDYPYFNKLRTKLREGFEKKNLKGITSIANIETIIFNLSFQGHPLLEKINTFLLYQDWYKGKNLIDASKTIASECEGFYSEIDKNTRYNETFHHFKQDLLAQIFRDTSKKQPYYGFESFVRISHGLPRHLLMILKHIYQWSFFNGEQPFAQKNNRITIESQIKGVRAASDWFFEDARRTGEYADSIRKGIENLATLCKDVRFSDKPSECSAAAFSTNTAECSPFTREILELSEKWSLILKIRHGQKEKSSKRVLDKYQLNRMLAPRWDLSIGYRGVLSLSPKEVDSIFDNTKDYSEFQKSLTKRVKGMNAPTFGKKLNKLSNDPNLTDLPLFQD
jgi:hypothetical protein